MTIKVFSFLLLISAFACQTAEEIKTEQYFAEGFQLYKSNCANCHQADGQGMANLYPPVAGAAAIKNPALLACLIKNGMKDTITVNGKSFSRPMPPNPKLMELEIAEIITYIGMKWGKDSVYTKIEFVAESLAGCKER